MKREELLMQLRAMPSSLNDACRTMEAAAEYIYRSKGAPDWEPDAWEWRAYIGGRWGAWLYLEQPIERFRERNEFNIQNRTYELRPLYALTPTQPYLTENIEPGAS